MAKDILLKQSDGDIDLTFGISFTDDAEPQMLRKMLDGNKGFLPAHPMAGAGIRRAINSPLGQTQVKEVYKQLEADGWTEEEIEIDGQNIYVDAKHS